MLFEEGRFNLDDPVANYLPELKDMKVWTGGTQDAPKLEPLKRPITIKHLLTHTSGLIYDFSGEDELTKLWRGADLWSGPGLTNFIAKLGKLPLKHQPGDAYTYGVNQDVLGALIERVSGKTFGAFLEERIFRPLRHEGHGLRCAGGQNGSPGQDLQARAGRQARGGETDPRDVAGAGAGH